MGAVPNASTMSRLVKTGRYIVTDHGQILVHAKAKIQLIRVATRNLELVYS